MAFNQRKLDKVYNQSRGIFDRWVYRSDEDTIAEITSPGYFAASRFADDPDWKDNPVFIDVLASDGPYEVQLAGGVAVALNPVLNISGESDLSLVTAGNIKLANDITITASYSLNSNTEFTGGGRSIIPASDGFAAFNIAGNGPASFSSLSADFSIGDTSFQSSSSFSVGQYVFIRSQRLIDGPNSESVKVAQIFKVTDVSGSTYYVDTPAEYDFLLADTAEAAVCDMKENITIKNLILNSEDFSDKFNIALRFSFVANLTIENVTIYGTKDKYGADVDGASAIKFINCLNVKVDNVKTKHIGWYGIEFAGACHGAQVNRHIGVDCRHSTDANWSEDYGAPINITYTNCDGIACTLSCHSTHDVAKRIKYVNCKAIGSIGDSGFQQRCADVEYISCIAEYNFFDGFVQRLTNDTPVLRDCKANYNSREGYNFPLGGASLYNCDAHGNSGEGAVMRKGLISGGTFTDNLRAIHVGGDDETYPQDILLVENLTAPASASQPRFAYFNGASNNDPALLHLYNSDISGYGDNTWLKANYSVNPRSPISNGNTLVKDAAGSETTGEAQLSGGTVTINTNAVIRNRITSAASVSMTTTPNIDLKITNASGTSGALYISSLADGTFTVNSTNASDTSIFQWSVTY